MDWTPLGEAELTTLIVDAVAVMEPPARSLSDVIRVRPVKWLLHPRGDEGGRFWVVGIIGKQVVWYNDVEDGFNVSRYDAPGEIAEYWCNRDALNHVTHALLHQIETGQAPWKVGPPEPIRSAAEPGAAADGGA
jgi:hypothetical protein